ncbi:hypothetical protein ACFL6T_04645 [Candidatus Zixiibacteriota bacterium]
MHRIKRACSIAAVVAILAAPSSAMALSDSPAEKYDACMDRAESSLLRCLDVSSELDYFCWSKYGYAKLWCTISYGVRSILN